MVQKEGGIKLFIIQDNVILIYGEFHNSQYLLAQLSVKIVPALTQAHDK